MLKQSYNETRFKNFFSHFRVVFLLPGDVLNYRRHYGQIKPLTMRFILDRYEIEWARQKGSKKCFVLPNCLQSRQKTSPAGLAEHV